MITLKSFVKVSNFLRFSQVSQNDMLDITENILNAQQQLAQERLFAQSRYATLDAQRQLHTYLPLNRRDS